MPNNVEPVIVAKKVSKHYGTFQVLKDCSFEVQIGEVVVICGPSGSGKSTLIKCLNGLEEFDKGHIVVDGVSLKAPGVDLARVMIETQKSAVSFRALTEVRNRLVSAYQDIMNMSI